MIVTDCVFDDREQYDLGLVAHGYERRASYSVRRGLQARTALALGLDYVAGASYEANELDFRNAGWRQAQFEEFRDAMSRLADGASVAVDISALPRSSIAGVVEILHAHPRGVRVDFLYCPAEFVSSSRAAFLSETLEAGPLSSAFAGELRPASIPIGLILGLGLESFRAVGLYELLEPARVWQFYAQGVDARFEAELGAQGLAASSRVGAARVVQYPIGSLREAYSRLESLLFATSPRYRMILAPSGPKVFSLACILAALEGGQYPRPAVWRVGGVQAGVGTDVVEEGSVFVGRVEFGPPASSAAVAAGLD